MIKRKYKENELLRYVEFSPKAYHYENKTILLHLNSFCLGDTICFSSFIQPFLEFYNPKKIIVSTFFDHLFESNEKIKFINANQNKKVFVDKLINVEYDKKKLEDTLGGMFYAAKKSLFLPLNTIPKNIFLKKIKREIQENKITISTESLKEMAKWNYKGNYGWQTVINYLFNKNYIIYNVSYEKSNFYNVYHLNGFDNINVSLTHMLQSKIFVGLNSGLSWLAWAYNIPVVMISNFTKKHNEFDCFKVENRSVCNGCFNLITNIKSNCPFYQNTIKQNECHNTITPDMVINKINEALVYSV